MSDASDAPRLTEAREREIRERLGAITPGEWEEGCGSVVVFHPEGRMLMEWTYNGVSPFKNLRRRADEAFIAAAPADVRVLLGEVERLRAENEALRQKEVKPDA